MKIKLLAAGLVIGTSMALVVAPVQAAHCYKHYPGWHMVSKKCDIRSAVTWQEYNSGIYTQPAGGGGILFFDR